MSTIGIIGAGPAGMMAALTAADSNHKVILFEANERVGKKILSTGNGKCNLSNVDMESKYFYSNHTDRIEEFLKQFSVTDTVHFFESLGIVLKEKSGYLYPNSEQASTILDALRFELERKNITLVSDFKVSSISTSKNSDTFVISSSAKQYEADKVILACGGKAAPKTGSDGSGYILAKKLGHHIVNVVPALVQLVCKESFMKSIAGVRTQATISLFKDFGHSVLLQKETGELQLTDYGISGIPVFQLSRTANRWLSNEKELFVTIDFLPNISKEQWNDIFRIREEVFLHRNAEEYYFGILNKKITALILRQAGIKPTEIAGSIPKEQRMKAFSLMRDFPLTIVGNKGFDYAQVSAGGVDLSEVTDQLESMLCPNLYFAGELLDVDGRCGGYNLQWAFTSGYIAGKAAIEKGR